jgi:hypothetical protein
MSGKNLRWHRAKTGKPTQFANVRFPRDSLGRRAKAAFEEWRQNPRRSAAIGGSRRDTDVQPCRSLNRKRHDGVMWPVLLVSDPVTDRKGTSA